ncbi:MAG: hypothetical protein LBI17_03790 [Rickettsiales bacterium]|jgi:hypothetical protein|nr:hypothetical protein [Rickettsiales bacterium]
MKKSLIFVFAAWLFPAGGALAINAKINALLDNPKYDRECLGRLLPALCPTKSRDPSVTTQWWFAGGRNAYADDACIERANISPCLVK